MSQDTLVNMTAASTGLQCTSTPVFSGKHAALYKLDPHTTALKDRTPLIPPSSNLSDAGFAHSLRSAKAPGQTKSANRFIHSPKKAFIVKMHAKVDKDSVGGHPFIKHVQHQTKSSTFAHR
jgi:hypothetical protein